MWQPSTPVTLACSTRSVTPPIAGRATVLIEAAATRAQLDPREHRCLRRRQQQGHDHGREVPLLSLQDPACTDSATHSAGAFSVGLHLLYAGQPSTNLFRGAILESGSATSNGYNSASDYEPSYRSVLNTTGCGSLACLRALPLPELVAATNKSVYSWNPVVDGTFLPDRPSVLIASGRMVRVPLLLGRACPISLRFLLSTSLTHLQKTRMRAPRSAGGTSTT
jgi:hypothetical protein